MKKSILSVAIACMFVTVACGHKHNEEKKVNPNLSKDMVLKAKPANAKTIVELKKSSPKVGDKVTVVGIIGGKRDNLLGGKLAIMYIIDESLGYGCTCGCVTPWDYHCTPNDVKTKNMATVKFLDKKGKVIKGNCENFGGLKPLARIYIEGKVVKFKDNNLHIAPEKFFVEETKASKGEIKHDKNKHKKGEECKDEHKSEKCTDKHCTDEHCDENKEAPKAAPKKKPESTCSEGCSH